MNEKQNTDSKPNQNVFPKGRWVSVPDKVEILRYMIGADEIKRRAIEQLIKQAAEEESA